MTPATGSDLPAVAARYAADVRLGVELLDARDGRNAGALRVALHRAAVGVLRYSERDEDLAVARQALADLERGRHTRNVRAVALELREHGASIDEKAIDAVIDARTRASNELELERLGLPPNRPR